LHNNGTDENDGKIVIVGFSKLQCEAFACSIFLKSTLYKNFEYYFALTLNSTDMEWISCIPL